MKWYLKVINQYADFNGRARRKEYWMFVLFNIIFLIIASLLDSALGLSFGDQYFGILYLLYVLFAIIPSLAVGVRRLHDIGKSGWMILISLIPVIGGIWFFILTILDSEPKENQYGPNPKGEMVAVG